MKKVFSFSKLFEHQLLEDLNLIDLYKDTKEIRVSQAGTHVDTIFTRLDTMKQSLVIAYRSTDHQTWVAVHPNRIREDEYSWRTRSHTMNEEKWDITFTAPEFEIGRDNGLRVWSNANLTIFPHLLAFVADMFDTVDTFKEVLNDSMIDVKHNHDILFRPYKGKLDGSRVGEFSFIHGQQNGTLMHAAVRAVNDMGEYKRDSNVHLLPYLGTMVPDADFERLTEILSFIKSTNLAHRPSHVISTTRATIIENLLDIIKTAAEERLKDIMKKEVQTVSLRQFTTDKRIIEQIEQGAKVNLLIDLNEMKWVD